MPKRAQFKYECADLSYKNRTIAQLFDHDGQPYCKDVDDANRWGHVIVRVLNNAINDGSMATLLADAASPREGLSDAAPRNLKEHLHSIQKLKEHLYSTRKLKS